MMTEEENSHPTPEGDDCKMVTDTSQAFEEIFGSTLAFDCWDDFATVMEEFQKKTGSSFKLKSASCVDYINEKRVHDQIPERFIYAKVKLICVHFGLPTVRGPGHRKSYVGKGCGAFLNVGYKKGALRVNQTHLVHTNHLLGQEGENLPLRQLRALTFTDELDLIISREVMEQNPFEFINGDKKWLQAVDNLKKSDVRLISITPRVLKKRIRVLIDKFLAFSNGRAPVQEDELGNLLYQFDKMRKEALDSATSRGRGHSARKRNNTSYAEEAEDVDDAEYIENSSGNEDPSFEVGRKRGSSSDIAPSKGKRRRGRPSKRRTSSPDLVARVKNEDEDSYGRDKRGKSSQNSAAEVKSLIRYLQQKDEQDQQLRQQEIDLRKEELTLLKNEMELHKQRLEMDRTERKALLTYLHAQAQAFQSSVSTMNSKQVSAATGSVTEYTILVDNNK